MSNIYTYSVTRSKDGDSPRLEAALGREKTSLHWPQIDSLKAFLNFNPILFKSELMNDLKMIH